MVNTEVMYNNLMNNFYWRELDNPEVYYSKDYRDFVANHRSAFNTLGSALIAEGNTERAKEVINHSLEVMPDEGVPFDYVTVLSAQILADAGDKERALELGTMLGDRAVNLLTYLVNNPEAQVDNELQKALITLQQLTYMFADLGDQEKATYYQQQFTQSYDVLRNRF
jgi:tetratricopeptide (TPR) repeat protein